MLERRVLEMFYCTICFVILTSVSPCSFCIVSMNRHTVGFVQDSRNRKPLYHPSAMFDDLGKPANTPPS